METDEAQDMSQVSGEMGYIKNITLKKSWESPIQLQICLVLYKTIVFLLLSGQVLQYFAMIECRSGYH